MAIGEDEISNDRFGRGDACNRRDAWKFGHGMSRKGKSALSPDDVRMDFPNGDFDEASYCFDIMGKG